MPDLERLLVRLENLAEGLADLDPGVRDRVFDLLDGLDALHRAAMSHLETALRAHGVDPRELRGGHPAIEWLFETYAVGVDEWAAAAAAVDAVRPLVREAGGGVELVSVEDDVVHLRLSGKCRADDEQLTSRLELELRQRFPGFAVLTVEDASANRTSTPLLQIQRRPPADFPG